MTDRNRHLSLPHTLPAHILPASFTRRKMATSEEQIRALTDAVAAWQLQDVGTYSFRVNSMG